MESTLIFSPLFLSATAIVVLCCGAALSVRGATLRLAEVPKLHYLREHVARKSAERDDLEGKISELRAELATADKEKAELSILRQEKEQHTLELADLEDRLANLAGDRAKIDEVQSQLATALDALAQATQDVRDVEAKKGDLEALVQSLVSKRDELQEGVAKLGSDIEQLREGKAILSKDLVAAKEDLDDTQRATRREREVLDGIQQQRATEAAALDEIRLSAERVKGEEAACKGAIDRLDRDQRELTEAIDKLTADRAAFTGEIASLKSQAESEGREIERLEDETERAEDRLHEIEQRCLAEGSTLSLLSQNVERAKGELAAAEGGISRLSTERQEVVSAISAGNEELHALAGEIATLRTNAEGVQREVKRLNGEAAEATARRDSEAAVVDELRHKRDALQGEIAVLTQMRGGLEGKPGSRTKEEAEETLADLRVAPEGLKRATRRMENLSEEEALNDVRKHLKSQGYAFSDRVINAFHTSLKISSISPLTVLAGISGTGKSELPRQYATAIGLPFFQLAVQPRWDSPQDLFGFYNYLEHRYKPTELVRVMVHLDTKFWPKEAEPYKDHMALVLLDEMNLARVEYYFSEFLSRLEVRRDRDNEPAAEIELELGHLPEEQSKKLYPVPRLLFVGTMNEDESTQTLSDKVVDRANVLRFSRPKDLKSSMEKSVKSEGQAELDRMLPFKVWKSWQRKDAPGGDARLDAWLSTLNGHMEMLGRPFGHRMGQAIRAYVVNHPRSAGGISPEPMADQLEMRLFPKLRGIDPNDDQNPAALDGIRKFIVTELQDEKLASAFEVARAKDLFLWRGVHRDL